MPARSPEEAVDAYIDNLRHVVGCVTGAPFIGTGYRLAPVVHYAAFIPETHPVRLRDEARTHQIALSVRFDYVVDNVEHAESGTRFDMRELSYRFHILDRDGREVLAYHWHPEGVSHVTEPHLHLSGRLRPLDVGQRDAPVALGEMHLPTGMVPLAQVVRLLITELGIEPRRDDWAAVLRDGAELRAAR